MSRRVSPWPRLRDDLAARLAQARARPLPRPASARPASSISDVRGLLERARAAAAQRRAALSSSTTSSTGRSFASSSPSSSLSLSSSSVAARLAALRERAQDAGRRSVAAGVGRAPGAHGSTGPAIAWRLTLFVAFAVVIALLRDACAEPPPPPPPTPPPSCAACPEAPLCVPPVRVARKLPPVPRSKSKVAPTPREALAVGERAPPPWLESFRRQVMARSTILAACFAGIDRPGAAWWTAQFDPGTGTATTGQLEAAQGSAPVSTEQAACVLRGLQDTRYALGPEGGLDPAPRRLRLLIEF